VDLDRINPYTRMVRDLNFQKGRFKGELWANWDDYSMKGLRYNGRLELDHVLAEVPFFKPPVTATGLVLVNEKRLELAQLELETDNSLLSAHGWLYDFLTKPRLDLDIHSRHLDIETILRGIKLKDLGPVLALRPRGVVQGDIKVQGLINLPEQLRYSGNIALPDFRMQDLALQAARASFSFADNRLKSKVHLAHGKWQDVQLSNGDADINYGLKRNHLQGIIHIAQGGWQDALLYDTRAIIDYQGKADRLKGEVWVGSGAWQDLTMGNARGVVDYAHNQATGQIWLQSASWQDVDLANGGASFHYRPDRVDAQINVGSGAYSDAEISSLRTGLVYTPQALYIHDLYARAFAGTLAGNALIGLGKSQALQARLDARGLDLGQIQSAFKLKVPADYRPAGRLNVLASASGTLNNPRADASFYSPRLLFPSSKVMSPFNDLQGKIHFTKPLTTLALRTNSTDAGLVRAAASLRNLDALQAKVEARQMPLRSVNRWAGQSYLEAGTASLDASMAGSLRAMQRNWMDFHGDASLLARNVDVHIPDAENKEGDADNDKAITQHLDVADVKLTWNRGLADIHDLVLANDDSRLEGHGKLSVPRLMSARSREHAFTGALKGDVDVADFPVLAKYDLQAGRIKLALTADTLRAGDIVASLRSSGENMRYRGVDLDMFRLSSDYADRLLKINEAALIQDDEQLLVKGSVDFKTTSPTLDLTANADDFDLKTVVALIPPDLRRQIEPGPEDLALPKHDDMPKEYQLPAINQRQIFRPDLDAVLTQVQPEELVISWKEIYDHWDRWKLEPGNTPYTPAIDKSQRLFDTLQGELSLDAGIKGTVANPDLQVQGLVENLKLQDASVPETFLDARLQNQVLNFNKFYLLEEDGGVLRVAGEVNLKKDINLEVTGEGLHLRLLKPFLSPEMRLNGKLDFYAVVEGPVKSPQVTSQANVDRLLLNRYFFDSLAALINYSGGYLKDTRLELNAGDQQVIAQGNVPVPDLTKPMDMSLQMSNESFGLINLFTNAIDWRSGKGALLVRVVGTPKSPQLEGTISLQDAEIYVPSLKEAITNFGMHGELTRHTNEFGLIEQGVELKDAKGNYGGGTIQASGKMDLLDLLPSYFD
ncbi:MAG: hypothetical protein ACAI44_00980, partial [Candidatus Sericytochromatia bacterium]